jgi:hypothetical protein
MLEAKKKQYAKIKCFIDGLIKLDLLKINIENAIQDTKNDPKNDPNNLNEKHYSINLLTIDSLDLKFILMIKGYQDSSCSLCIGNFVISNDLIDKIR